MAKKKILVIDDDPDIIDIVRASLQKEPYDIVVAYDGQEGVEKARAEKPDGIILDIMMPNKDGFTACHELKHDPACKQIPVLILTAVGQHFATTRYAKSQGLALESDDYVEKPINPQVLVERVRELLGG
ncbi:MAG: response regulator [Planctomycetota bacterium]|nr:response regulator [Planctomycetota bacterium]